MPPLGRLRKGREFDEVYREGVAVSGSLLVLRCLPAGANGAFGPPQWGFAVGKRIAKSSVDRNHARRRLRECARSFAVAPGTKLVVTLRPAGLKAPFEALRRNLSRALASSGVLLEDAPQ